MARMTAVQWMARELGITSGTMLEKAMEIEREQMEDAYDKGKTYDCMAPDDSFDAYYNKYYEREGDYDDYLDKLKYLKYL